jgi:uncharacterized damage-inducible protein DinB
MSISDPSLASALVAEVQSQFHLAMHKIEHCTEQLDDDQAWWRPREDLNSVANLLLHLSGNLRQWLIAGVGQQPDVRNRPAEFADRSHRPKQQVLDVLRQTMREVHALLPRLRPEDLLQPRRIQGQDQTVLGALLQTVTHLHGHAQEIIHLTRVQLGESYRFDYVPSTPEQKSMTGPAI